MSAAPDAGADAAEVARLASLDSLAYDRERKPAAKRLGVRPATLDGMVKPLRVNTQGGDVGKQGTALALPQPEPWPEPVNGADLLDEMEALLKRHAVLPEGAPLVVALWCLHTFIFQRFRHTPRLAITSPEKGCGKTTVLDLCGLLTCKPLSAANITPAAVYRVIEAARPTLLIDEADTFIGENEALRGVLNAGHKEGGSVVRCVGDDAEPRSFNVFAPAAIALIGKLPGTLADRSLSVTMRRAQGKERPARIGRAAEASADDLVSKAARWAADNKEALTDPDPKLPDAMVNRVADNWRALFAIAEAVGGEWLYRLSAAAELLAKANQDDALSDQVTLLADVRMIFRELSATRITSADLCKRLAEMEDRPWPEWKNGKPITPSQLAVLLKPFGIRPATIRTGVATAKGYYRDAFTDAWARYVTQDSEENGADGGSEPSQRNDGVLSDTYGQNENVTQSGVCRNEYALESRFSAGCDGVTARNGGYPS